MYSIGEISKIVNISIDTLRYYDEIGLLKPCHIEQDNRYRYYSEEQVKDILSIIEMKKYGFSLDTIKELLNNNDHSQFLGIFYDKLQQLHIENNEIEKTIKSLKRKISDLKSKDENHMESLSVLTIDDSDFMRLMLRDILEKHDYTIISEAANGQEGVENYIKSKPNLVILDIHMAEDFDGLDALKKIMLFDSNAKIIMLSALGSLPIVLESIKAGAKNFIVKPFGADALLNGIDKVISDYNYNFDTDNISAFQSNQNLHEKAANYPLSQKNIDELLTMCTVGYPLHNNAISDFIENF